MEKDKTDTEQNPPQKAGTTKGTTTQPDEADVEEFKTRKQLSKKAGEEEEKQKKNDAKDDE